MEFYDIRSRYKEEGIEYVWDDMRKQWPSNPLPPSINKQETSGIDCVCILYRHIQSTLRGKGCPVGLDDKLKDDSTLDILRFLWADFDSPRRMFQGEALARTRNAALQQMLKGVDHSGEEKYSFAALNSSSAMGQIIWHLDAFLFYKSIFTKGDESEAWIQRYTDSYPTSERAALSRLLWEIRDDKDNLQEFISRTEFVGNQSSELCIDSPLVIQVRFTIPLKFKAGLRMTDIYSFMARIIPGFDVVSTDDDGKMEEVLFHSPIPNPYSLTAAVWLRSQENPSDSIRLFDVNGLEILPASDELLNPATRPTWGFKVNEVLPQGQTFIFFYRKVKDVPSWGPVDASNNPIMALAALNSFPYFALNRSESLRIKRPYGQDIGGPLDKSDHQL